MVARALRTDDESYNELSMLLAETSNASEMDDKIDRILDLVKTNRQHKGASMGPASGDRMLSVLARKNSGAKTEFDRMSSRFQQDNKASTRVSFKGPTGEGSMGPRHMMITKPGTDQISALHARTDELLNLRKDINRREREKVLILRRLREKLELQEKAFEKTEASLSKAKEMLKQKDGIATGLVDKLREMEKGLKRMQEENNALSDSVSRLKARLDRLHEANKALQKEIIAINGKIGSLGNDVESHLRNRK